jgi:hypothetical protein
LGLGSTQGILAFQCPALIFVLHNAFEVDLRREILSNCCVFGFSFETWLYTRNTGTSVPSDYIVLHNAFGVDLR